MALSIYRIAELVAAGKAQIRSAISSVGTEDGADLSLLVNVAGKMFQVGQVAAKYVYDQILPATADATNRERMLDYAGLSLEKEATKARGLILLVGEAGTVCPAGTSITFPAASFADGVARTYVTLEDASFRAASEDYAMDILAGSTEWKLLAANVSGARNVHGAVPGEVIRISYDGTDVTEFNSILRVSHEDVSLELHRPMFAKPVAGEQIVNTWTEGAVTASGTVVAAECTVAGKAGNAAFGSVNGAASDSFLAAQVVDMAGGGDAVVGTDADEERQVRLIEDTAAGAPALGNMAHWREIAISCPDVDVDDAVVYQHVRGPGTVDIVCIGRTGRMVPANFAEARTDFTHGLNGRRIGTVQAAKVQAWCDTFTSYHDDVKVRSVEYEFMGEDEANDDYGDAEFFRSVTDLKITVTAQDGYGPDCGVNVAPITPYIATYAVESSTKLYSTGSTTELDESIAAGQRVWVRIRPTSTGLTANRAPALTIVTTILSVDKSRIYVTVPGLAYADAEGGKFYQAAILDWGVAGPLTQPIIDATYDYYDQLGPGGYIDAPKDPNYVRQFETGTAEVAPYSGISLSRWPPEGRRWAGGFRGSELFARLMAIKGVKSVAMDFADFDPLPFYTLAPRSVVARY